MDNTNADKDVIVTDAPAGTLSDEQAGIASDAPMGISTDEGIGTVTDGKVGKVEEAKYYNDEEAIPEKPQGQHYNIGMQDICDALFEMGLSAATSKWSEWMARLEAGFEKMDSGSKKVNGHKDTIDIPKPTFDEKLQEKNAVRNVDVSEMTFEEAQTCKAELAKEGVENKKAIDGAGKIVGQSRVEQKGLKTGLTAEILKKNKGQRV